MTYHARQTLSEAVGIDPILDVTRPSPSYGSQIAVVGSLIDHDLEGTISLADVPQALLDLELNDLGVKLLSDAESSELRRRINRALDDVKKHYNPKPAYKVRKQGSQYQPDDRPDITRRLFIGYDA